MSKSSDKTILTVGVIAILGFLAYKLWPAIRAKLQGGGSSGGGGGAYGGGSAQGQYPQYGQEGQQGGGLGGGIGAGPGGSNGNGGGGGGSLGAWLSSILNAGYDTAATDPALSSDYLPGEDPLAQLDTAGLPLEQTDYGNQDNFLVTQDVPGSDSTDYGDDYFDPTSYDSSVITGGPYTGDSDSNVDNGYNDSGNDSDFLY